MLSRIAALTLLLAAAGCSAPAAGLASDSAEPAQVRAEAALATLLAAAAAPDGDLATLAPLLAVQGGDDGRSWRAPSDRSAPDEAAAARELSVRLQGLLRDVRMAGRFQYAVRAFELDPTDEGPWHVLRARFDDARQTEIRAAFLPVGEKLLLGRLSR